MLDSLVRLGIADLAKIEIYTLDISQDLNLHIEHARKKENWGVPTLCSWRGIQPAP